MYLHPVITRALAAERQADWLRQARRDRQSQRRRSRSIMRRSRLVGRPVEASLTTPAAAG